MQYNNPAISIADQIQLLESRGLIINDRASAENFLSNISYYRLAGYWWTLQSDKAQHQFKPGSDFESVIAIYNFDIKAMGFPENWENEPLFKSQAI